MFSRTYLPVTLMVAGLLMAITEELTYKSGAGGILFGSSGMLRPIDAMLPQWTIPGTQAISVRYPGGIPVRLDSWLVIIGAILYYIL